MVEKYFLEAQEYRVGASNMYQDNMSTMLDEKNGKVLNKNRTMHINVRYLFVKDRVNAGDVVIDYYPTDDMCGGFFTKPP